MPPMYRKNKRLRILNLSLQPLFLTVLICVLFVFNMSCIAPHRYLEGVTPEGKKVYAGSLPIEATEPYRNYFYSSQSEARKLDYLFERLKTAQDLGFYYDGVKYNWLETYRAGKWLLRHRYREGDDARTFTRNYVWHSEQTGKPNLVELPDGSIHVGYYLLMNELDLLEESAGMGLKPTALDPKAESNTAD